MIDLKNKEIGKAEEEKDVKEPAISYEEQLKLLLDNLNKNE